jgi:hypothetical protein
VVVGEGLAALVGWVPFIVWFEVDDRLDGLALPWALGWAVEEPPQVRVGVAMAALVAVKAKPGLVAELRSDPGLAAGVHGDQSGRDARTTRRVGIEEPPPDAVPALGFLAVIVAVAAEDPHYRVAAPAVDDVTGHCDGIVFGDVDAGVFVRQRPQQHRGRDQAVLADHLHASVSSGEKIIVHSQRVQTEGPLIIIRPPVRADELDDVEALFGTNSEILLPLLVRGFEDAIPGGVGEPEEWRAIAG